MLEFGVGIANIYSLDRDGNPVYKSYDVGEYEFSDNILTIIGGNLLINENIIDGENALISSETENYDGGDATVDSENYLLDGGSAFGEDTYTNRFFQLNRYVIIERRDGEIDYAYGKIKSITEIELDQENGDSSWLEEYSGDLIIYDGIFLALFESAVIDQTTSGQGYKGSGLFNKDYYSTDVDTNLTINNTIFNMEIEKYIRNLEQFEDENIDVFSLLDNEYQLSLNYSPMDVRIQLLKQTSQDNLKHEEVILYRVCSATMNIPTERDAFMADNVEFDLKQKTMYDTRLIAYTIEE